ncbi:hypothetical protein MKW98_018868 [Papaver atlanticum]|uniref:Uncharacterized protein n=1 Tax=Papaver atlanticum TaxID=357466 RepID=A0AAD4XYR0_9MAGN|nr:hypothetical protein MKW98_018868 [Papaver atlanticum]
MASLKRFSLTHVVIALIFGVILASSLANAVRTIGYDDECNYECTVLAFRNATCTPLKSHLSGDKYCCCYNELGLRH